MKKRIFAALLATAMVASLAACGGKETTESTGSTGGSTGSTSTSTGGNDAADEPAGDDAASDPAAEAIANRTETQTVILNWPTYTGTLGGVDRVVAKMNELTVPALNIQMEMQLTDFATRSQSLTLAISGGEQLDLVSSIGIGYVNGITTDYWEDLEQDVDGHNLIQTYGADLLEQMGDTVINAARYTDGTLYGVPQEKENAQGRYALCMRTSALKNAESAMDLVPDYESSEWMVSGVEDLVTIIKAVKDTNSDATAFGPGGLQAGWTDVDALAGDYFGVLDNFGQGEDGKKVVNYFETPSYLRMVNAMRELYEYGCISPADVTDTTSVTTRVVAKSLHSYPTNFKPGSDIQESNLCADDMTIIMAGPNFTGSNSIASMPWCICVNTEDVVASMQYMNFMYTSPEWNELFKWGEKGIDFEEIDGTAKFVENAEYNHALQWLCPGQFQAMPEYGNPTNLWDVYSTFNGEAIISEASGFVFDKNPVVNEYTALSNVYTEYQKMIEYGTVDPESAIAEMLAEMESAGLSKYIAEKQTQYDAWRAANGK